MNSKELLEQADQRIAEVEDIKKARKGIEDLEYLCGMVQNEITQIDIRQGNKLESVSLVISQEQYKEFKDSISSTLERFIKTQIIKLEQLLGITPKIVNPEFEAVIRDMEQSNSQKTSTYVVNSALDPVEEKMTETQRIEAPQEDKSLDKYPAPKKDNGKKYPENMTVEDVTRMYITEGKSRKQIQEHYRIKESTLNNFLYLNGISRKSSKPEKIPEETEHP